MNDVKVESGWGHLRVKAVIAALVTIVALAGGLAFAGDVHVVVEGDLGQRIHEADDTTGQTAWVEYLLEELEGGELPTGTTYSLAQSSLVSQIDPGWTIRVEGTLHDDVLLIPDHVWAMAPPPSHGSPTCALGDQDMIVIIANFQDKQVAAECTQSAVNDIVFNPNISTNVNAYWDEDAFNSPADSRFSFTGVVTSVLTLPYTSAPDCSSIKIAKLADQVATSQGYVLGDYAHRFYIFPDVPNTDCSGAFSDGPSVKIKRSYNFGGCDIHAFVHEYGHDLGMGHAGVPGDDYGDLSDVMGGAIAGDYTDLRHNHGAHKFSTCFVPETRVTTDPGNGTYTLGVLSQDVGGQPQVIRVKNIAGSGKYAWDYFLSFRLAQGFDSYLPTLHVGRTSIYAFQVALSDANFQPTSELIGVIGDGQEYRDYDIGLTVKQVTHSGPAAQVQITHGTPQTDTDPPGPATGLGWQSPGTWVWLSWQLPLPNSDINQYRGFKVYRNNVEIGTTPYQQFVDRNVIKYQTYTYYVRSYDDAGNLSTPSNTVEATSGGTP